MKIVEINKYKKKIKLIKHKEYFEIVGPLGTIHYNYSNVINNKVVNDIFINTTSFNFFINKIGALFKSVSLGWYKELTFKGIGYKCFKIEDKIALDLGYSNLITYKPGSDIKIKNLKGKIVLFGINQENLNNVVMSLKRYSIPDKYKGKGIWLKNEVVKLKKKS